jgi:hypothetical protein
MTKNSVLQKREGGREGEREEGRKEGRKEKFNEENILMLSYISEGFTTSYLQQKFPRVFSRFYIPGDPMLFI